MGVHASAANAEHWRAPRVRTGEGSQPPNASVFAEATTSERRRHHRHAGRRLRGWCIGGHARDRRRRALRPGPRDHPQHDPAPRGVHVAARDHPCGDRRRDAPALLRQRARARGPHDRGALATRGPWRSEAGERGVGPYALLPVRRRAAVLRADARQAGVGPCQAGLIVCPAPSLGNNRAMAKKILALVTEPISGEALKSAVGRETAEEAEVLVVAPALNSKLRFWTSDPDDAIARAEEVEQETVERLDEEGIDAAGDTGESDPLLAIQDSLQTYPADEIVLVTHAAGERNWQEEGVVDEARERFGKPVTHLIVD